MHNERGNFLLQTLLALTLVFSFIPFLASRLAARDKDAQMYASTRQIDIAQTAARIYVRENANEFPYETTILSGREFTDTLEPYGLPLGFMPRTAMGNDISLVINKTGGAVIAYLSVDGENMSELTRAELARRIGYYATPSGNAVLVGLALDDVYSDVVRRNETNLDNAAFLTNLDMGGFDLDNVGAIFARRGEFETGNFDTLVIDGSESGRKERSNIVSVNTDKTIFQSALGEAALTLSRGVLDVGTIDARTVSRFGDTGYFSSNVASVYNFSMTAGRTGFVGPSKWDVRGNVITDKVSFSTEVLEVKSFLTAARGQDVYIDEDTLEYNNRSGIETATIAASNITLRDQTSNSLLSGGTGAVVLDIRPAGTSLLPDVLINSVDNNAFKIIKSPTTDSADTIDCKAIISDLDATYNQRSLSQYIICQYIYWKRLEERINIKQCLLDGRGDCE